MYQQQIWMVTTEKYKMKNIAFRDVMPSSLAHTPIFYLALMHDAWLTSYAQRIPGGLGSQIFMTFGTWRWWSRQSHAPAAFTPRNVPGTHFQ
jgi:hypothetical protein